MPHFVPYAPENVPENDPSLIGYEDTYWRGQELAKRVSSLELSSNMLPSLFQVFEMAYVPLHSLFKTSDWLANKPTGVSTLETRFDEASNRENKNKILSELTQLWRKAAAISRVVTEDGDLNLLSEDEFSFYRETGKLRWIMKDQLLPADFAQVIAYIALSSFSNSPVAAFEKIASTLEQEIPLAEDKNISFNEIVVNEFRQALSYDGGHARRVCLRGFLAATCKEFIEKFHAELRELRDECQGLDRYDRKQEILGKIAL